MGDDSGKAVALLFLGLFFGIIGARAANQSSTTTITNNTTTSGGGPAPSGTPVRNAISVGTSSTLLLSANANRLSFVVVNEGNNTAYLTFGATASAADYTFILEPGAQHQDEQRYTGPVSMITAAGTNTAHVTELLP